MLTHRRSWICCICLFLCKTRLLWVLCIPCGPKLPAKNNLTFTSSCAISTTTRILFLVSNPYLDYVFLNPKNPQKFPQKLSIKIQKSSKLSILDPTFGTFGSAQGEKFAFWPDGGCLIAGTDSQRVIAEDYEVISGRRAP